LHARMRLSSVSFGGRAAGRVVWNEVVLCTFRKGERMHACMHLSSASCAGWAAERVVRDVVVLCTFQGVHNRARARTHSRMHAPELCLLWWSDCVACGVGAGPLLEVRGGARGPRQCPLSAGIAMGDGEGRAEGCWPSSLPPHMRHRLWSHAVHPWRGFCVGVFAQAVAPFPKFM